MSRLLAGVLASASALCVVADVNYSMYCKYQCGDTYKTSCDEGSQCHPADASCSLFASQAFYFGSEPQAHKICKEYEAYAPECDGNTKQCKDADAFQLICDRQADLFRDFHNRDWHGVALMFHENTMAFSPGGTAFMRVAEVTAAFEQLAKDSATLDFDLKQILTPGGNLSAATVLHAVGVTTASKAANGGGPPLPSYSRWEKNVNGHWVIESMVMQGLTGKASGLSLPADDDVFTVISKRSKEFSDKYNAKEYAQLKGFYADSAVFVPHDGRLLPQAALEEFFAKRPLGEDAKLNSVIVTRSPDSSVLDEIGYSDSTQAGYYTRWISQGGEWKIDVHCFDIFPKAGVDAVVV